LSNCLTQESKFLVLNRKSAWDRGLSINLDVSDDGLKIREVFEYEFELENEITVLSDTFEVTDFAVAECNQLYILDAATPAIWIYDTNQKRIERIQCISPILKKPTAIAYAAGILYVADLEAEARVFAFSTRNWQVRDTIGNSPGSDSLPLSQPFGPIDLAVDQSGNLFALDRENFVVLKFNEALRLVQIFDQAGLSGKNPTNIALSRKGMLYVFERNDQVVFRLPTAESEISVKKFIEFNALKNDGVLPKALRPSDLDVDDEGNLFVGDSRPRDPKQEDDRFIRRFTPDGKYAGVVEDYRGAADQLAIDLESSIFVFRKEDKNKITALRRQKRFALSESSSLVKGEYFSAALDSRDARTIWHKLSSTTTSAVGGQIQISVLAADEKRMKIAETNQDLDDFLNRAKSLTGTQFQTALGDLDKLGWSKSVVNSDDALVTAAGRYLWVRIILIGSEHASPEVCSVRLDYPRISYLRYLPAVYQEDDRSRDFLEQFLSLFETFFAGLEARIDHIARYFDPDSSLVSTDFLRWLSTWLAISVDNNWDDAKLRELVKRAPEIYKKRGTRAAIEDMIEIFTGEKPLIIEHHQLSCASPGNESPPSDSKEIEDLYKQLYGTDPFCFCVLLKPFPVQTEESYRAVRRLLDSEKPAHTCAGLLRLQPWVQLDAHTYLEVNTYLSEPSARLDLGSAMPRDTVLDTDEHVGHLEWHSRLGLDTTLI
jgi:phage tail-like protein